MPIVIQLSQSPVFNKRMTSIRTIHKLGKTLGIDESFECLKTLTKDKIPNIRFNVAKTLKALADVWPNKRIVKEALESIKNDPDADVRFFAEDALKSL